MPTPIIAPSPKGVIYACAFVGTNPTIFERVQRGDKRTYRRTGNLIYDRVRVWTFIRAVWGWTFPEIAQQTGTNWSTIITAFKKHGRTRQMLDEYRECVKNGSIKPVVVVNIETDPREMIEVLPEVVPIYRGEYRRKTEPKHLPVNRVRKDSSARCHRSDCECGVCQRGMDVGRRLAAREELTANDVDPGVLKFFLRARAEMENKTQ